MADGTPDIDSDTQLAALKYSELKPQYIRVMHLKPSLDSTSALIFQFQEGTFDDLGNQYEALSYTWGEPVFSRQLFSVDRRHLGITENLDAALRRLRLPTTYRTLWVDAICINQADSNEKSFQIPLMGNIYRKAAAVAVWLGHGDPAVEAAIHSITQSSRVSAYNKRSLESKKSSNDALVKVLTLPYFSRRWIIQEVALNLDVMMFYDKTKISWLRLVTAFRLLQNSGLEAASGTLRAVHAMSKLWSYHSQAGRKTESYDEKKTHREDEITSDTSIISLLDNLTSSQCSDPRDIIYAITGMATDVTIGVSEQGVQSKQVIALRIDYTLNVESVFVQFARAAIPQGWAFELLYAAAERARAYTSSSTSIKLPSWVPDWRVQPMKFGWKTGRSFERLSNGHYRFEFDRKTPWDLQIRDIHTLTIRFRSRIGRLDYVRTAPHFLESIEGSRQEKEDVIQFIYTFLQTASSPCSLFKSGEPSWNSEKRIISIAALLGLHIPVLSGSFENLGYENIKELLDSQSDEVLSTGARSLLTELRKTLPGCSYFVADLNDDMRRDSIRWIGHTYVAVQPRDRLVVTPKSFVGLPRTLPMWRGSKRKMFAGLKVSHALLFRQIPDDRWSRWRLLGEAGLVQYVCHQGCLTGSILPREEEKGCGVHRTISDALWGGGREDFEISLA